MAKARRVFVCRSCGSAQSRWLGKCPDCGAWDSLEETTVDPAAEQDAQRGIAVAAGELALQADGEDALGPGGGAVTLAEIAAAGDSVRVDRLPGGIRELDRVLGGGLVVGSAVLIGGEPGIGKSTLLLQSAFAWALRVERRVGPAGGHAGHAIGLGR